MGVGFLRELSGINKRQPNSLKNRAFPAYGHRGFLVDIPKGARMYSSLINRPLPSPVLLLRGVRPFVTLMQIAVSFSSPVPRMYSQRSEDSSPIINPVLSYENADTQKLLILKENKNKGGVYR
jgi:hypothetical protein